MPLRFVRGGFSQPWEDPGDDAGHEGFSFPALSSFGLAFFWGKDDKTFIIYCSALRTGAPIYIFHHTFNASGSFGSQNNSFFDTELA